MTERTPWWKAFLPKKKAPKDQAFDVNFDPWAKSSPAASKASQPVSNNSSSLLSDETFDDSRLDSVFNEQTCRRNMNISRSGRFKEKKKIRTTIPIEQKEKENVTSGREDARWQQGVKSRAIKDCFTEMLEDGGEEEIKVYEDVSLSWSMPGILLIFLFFLLFYMLVIMKTMSIQVLAQYWKKRMILDICWCTLPESQKNSVSNITLRKQECPFSFQCSICVSGRNCS